jgi:hypothetical protein
MSLYPSLETTSLLNDVIPTNYTTTVNNKDHHEKHYKTEQQTLKSTLTTIALQEETLSLSHRELAPYILCNKTFLKSACIVLFIVSIIALIPILIFGNVFICECLGTSVVNVLSLGYVKEAERECKEWRLAWKTNSAALGFLTMWSLGILILVLIACIIYFTVAHCFKRLFRFIGHGY